MKGVLAYRSPIVLARVAAELAEPYRSVLLVHAHAPRANRELIITARLTDVSTESGVVTVNGCTLDAKGQAYLRAYLRDYLSAIQSEYLFPLPSDPTKHANQVVCKRQLMHIVNGKPATGAASATIPEASP